MRFTVAFFLILAMNPVFGFPRHISPEPQTDSAYELWRVRSDTITDDLLKDATALSPTRRAVLWARLARQWWRHDKRKAGKWINDAIEILEYVPNMENPEEQRRRLSTARLLLQIVAPLDRDLGKRLVMIFTKDIESSTEAERGSNVEGLLNAAVSLVDHDPKRAAELGTLALRLGTPNDIAPLLFALRRKDAKLADDLLVQALAVAKRSLPAAFLNSLVYAAFPAQMGLGSNIAAPPDSLRAELLQMTAAFINANPINAENQSEICAGIGAFVAPLLIEFDRLAPQQSVVVRHAINRCQSLSPLAQQRMADASSDVPLNTVEALLKAAADANDMKVRTVYEYRAALLAKENKDYDRALKILDGMSKESREFMGGSWEAYRWEWAAFSALDHYKRGELQEMNLVLNEVPRDLQPYAKAAFVDRRPDKKAEGDPSLQFLSDARVGLRRSSAPESEKYSWYFALLRLIVKYQPTEAAEALREAIASLNRALQASDAKVQPNTLDTTELSKTLPASLLEMDEFTVKEALGSVTAVETRAQLRLELLETTLQRMKDARQPKPNTKTKAPAAN